MVRSVFFVGLLLSETYLTVPEALHQIFPAPTIVEKRSAFLTTLQMEKAKAAAGTDVPVESALVTYYEASREGKPVGRAYLDTHTVRTLSETVLIVLAPDRSVDRVEVLSFTEPPDYKASRPWLDQFSGRSPSDDLSLKGKIRGITGATLTALSLSKAVRRIRAIDGVIHSEGVRGTDRR